MTGAVGAGPRSQAELNRQSLRIPQPLSPIEAARFGIAQKVWAQLGVDHVAVWTVALTVRDVRYQLTSDGRELVFASLLDYRRLRRLFFRELGVLLPTRAQWEAHVQARRASAREVGW